MTGADAGGWLVEALVASALLMLLVLATRAQVRRVFGPQIAYWLWALPALRLMLPPLPEGWRETVGAPMARAGEMAIVLIEPGGAAPATSAIPPVPWAMLLVTGWAIGAAGFFALHLWRHRRFCARLIRGSRMVDRIDGVRVIESDAARGPLAFGLARRFVAFPADFADRYDADERALALAHELAHHQRGDLAANWLALGVLALHWFNPVAWRAFRAFRCDQELANDARVLAGRSRADRHAYACAIVKAAHGGAVSAACHLHTIADLKGRLKMLTNTRISRARFAAGMAAVSGLVATGLVLTASGTKAAAAVSERIEAAATTVLRTPATPLPPARTPGRHVNRILVVKDGQTRVLEGAEATRYAAEHALPVPPTSATPVTPVGAAAPVSPVAPMAPAAPGAPAVPMPPVSVSSADCGPGAARAFVVTRAGQGGAQTVICTDRIQAAAMAGRLSAADQRDIQRKAMTAALDGLRAGRAAMLAGNGMASTARDEAIAGIDESIAELRGDIADINGD